MLDSNPNEPTSSEKMPPRENEENDDVKKAEQDEDDELNSRASRDNIDRPVGRAVADLISEDQDAETVALSRLRCTSIRTEEIADREKQKKSREQRRNRCADYPGLAFGSAAFGSETMMKFNIIKNELHNIMRSQLKRVDGEVAALSQRIKALDDNLAKSEEYIKTATAALADAVAMEVDRNDADQDEENNNPLSQFDAQMAILEGRLLQAKYLASKASSQTIINSTSEDSTSTSVVNNIATTTTAGTVTIAEKPPPKLRRPFPVP